VLFDEQAARAVSENKRIEWRIVTSTPWWPHARPRLEESAAPNFRAHFLRAGRTIRGKSSAMNRGRLAALLFWARLAFATSALLAFPRSAHAEGAFALSWHAAPECPSEAEVARKIDELVGPNHAADALMARVVITSHGAAWHASITLTRSDVSSERVVDGESCASVTDVATVIVALAADPQSAEPVSTPAPTASLVVTNEPPNREEPAPAERASVRPLYAGASVLIDGTMLASTSVGPELVFGWRHRSVRLEVSAAFLPPVRGTVATNGSEGAELWLLRGGTRACWLPLASTIEVGPCAGLGLDMVSGHGFGAASTTSTTMWTVTSSFGAMGSVRLTDTLSVRAGAGALVPFARPTFVIEGPGFVHRLPVASFAMSAGVELHFP
jgi:hypothetical protein